VRPRQYIVIWHWALGIAPLISNFSFALSQADHKYSRQPLTGPTQTKLHGRSSSSIRNNVSFHLRSVFSLSQETKRILNFLSFSNQTKLSPTSLSKYSALAIVMVFMMVLFLSSTISNAMDSITLSPLEQNDKAMNLNRKIQLLDNSIQGIGLLAPPKGTLIPHSSNHESCLRTSQT